MTPRVKSSREQDQHQHDHQVFHHQPADGDAAVDRTQRATGLQGTQQDYRAGHREAQPQHQRTARAPPPCPCGCRAEQGGHRDLREGARDRDPAHCEQIFHGEMQSHAEHHEHDADLSQLPGEGQIGDESGRGGTDDDTRDEIPDQ
jgi:hypothetical protein